MIMRYYISGCYCPIHRSHWKNPFWCRDHTKMSLWSCSWISITLATSWCHKSKLLATRDLRKEIFSGVELRTWLTNADFFLAMLYRVGYWFLRGLLSSQESSQNLIWDPLPSLNLPHLRNSDLTLMRPDQKCESPGKCSTWVRDLYWKYFLLSRVCHIPCSFISLKSHLLSKHLFCASRFKIPKPPWSFEQQRTLHLVSLYFFLCSLLCQKKPRSIEI